MSAKKKRIDTLLDQLIQHAKQLTAGPSADPNPLFDLTREDLVPDRIAELAESFGMLIVKLEAREYKLELTIDELKETNKELLFFVRIRATQAGPAFFIVHCHL